VLEKAGNVVVGQASSGSFDYALRAALRMTALFLRKDAPRFHSGWRIFVNSLTQALGQVDTS
jgi:hypothetical protein